MHKNLLAPIVIAFSALALPPVALSAGPQTGDAEHDHSHGQASAATPQKPKKAAQSPQKRIGIRLWTARLRICVLCMSGSRVPRRQMSVRH